MAEESGEYYKFHQMTHYGHLLGYIPDLYIKRILGLDSGRGSFLIDIVKKVFSSEHHNNIFSSFFWSKVKKCLMIILKSGFIMVNILWVIMTFQIWARKYNVTL
jgi:hypothetical protein